MKNILILLLMCTCFVTAEPATELNRISDEISSIKLRDAKTHVRGLTKLEYEDLRARVETLPLEVPVGDWNRLWDYDVIHSEYYKDLYELFWWRSDDRKTRVAILVNFYLKFEYGTTAVPDFNLYAKRFVDAEKKKRVEEIETSWRLAIKIQAQLNKR